MKAKERYSPEEIKIATEEALGRLGIQRDKPWDSRAVLEGAIEGYKIQVRSNPRAFSHTITGEAFDFRLD